VSISVFRSNYIFNCDEGNTKLFEFIIELKSTNSLFEITLESLTRLGFDKREYDYKNRA